MGNALVYTAVAVTIVLVGIDVIEARRQGAKPRWLNLLAGALCCAAAFAVFKGVKPPETALVLTALLASLGVALALFDFPDADRETRTGISLAPIAVVLGIWMPRILDQPLMVFGVLAGLAAASLALSGLGRGRVAQDIAVAGFIGFAVNAMANVSPGGQAVEAAQTLLTGAAIAVLIGEGLRIATAKSNFQWPRFGTALIFGLIATLLCTKVLADGSAAMVVGAASILSLVCAFAIRPDSKFGSSAILIGSLSWLGLATVAFGEARAYGVALAALTGFATLLISGNRKLLPVLAPIAAFVGYRMLRGSFGMATSTFEIGQHYALLGLIAGLGIPLLASETVSAVASSTEWKRGVTIGTVGVASLVVVAGLIEFLGDQGGVGLVLGLGVSPVVAALSGKFGQGSLATACGLMAWAAGTVGVLADHDPVMRQGKVWIIGTMASVIVLSSVIVWAINRQKDHQQA